MKNLSTVANDRDFLWVIQQLTIINDGIMNLRKLPKRDGVSAQERMKTAHLIEQTTNELVAAFNLFTVCHLEEPVVAIIKNRADATLQLFPQLKEYVTWSDWMKTPSSAEYSVYLLLDAYVQNALKKEFPSIIGLDVLDKGFPKVMLPSLGCASITFGDYREAKACFDKYVKPNGYLNRD